MGDCNENFLVTYAAGIHHHCLVIKAELWGIYYGLKTPLNRGFHRIKVVSDLLSVLFCLKMVVRQLTPIIC